MRNAPVYRRPWWLGIIVFAVVLAVDVQLLAPWVSWEHDSQDSGDLICSAYYLGIPHPTGYPTYSLLAKLIQTILPLGSIAWRTNLFSALCAAACCAAVALAVHHALHIMGREQNRIYPSISLALSGMAGLGLGFSRTFLSQSVVTEVYTLNAVFIAIDTALIVQILDLSRDGSALGRLRGSLAALAAFYGLTLTNHLSSAFIAPLVVAAFISGRRALSLKMLLLCFGGFIAGLAPYLYLPIRSAADTPFDWGNPETYGGFMWVVSGLQFKHLMFASFDYQVVHRLFDKFEPTIEVGPVLAVAALWGATAAFRGGLASRIALVGLFLIILNLFPVMNYHISDTQSFLLPTFIGLILLSSIGLFDIIQRLARRGKKAAAILILGAVLLGSGPWYAVNIAFADVSWEERPREYATGVYESLPPGAILIETYYGRAFTMWYKHYIEPGERRKDVAIIYSEHLMFDWGIENLRRQYPWVDFPKANPSEEKAIEALAERNALKTPIFLSREVASLKKSFTFEPFGEIFLLRSIAPDTNKRHN